MGYNIELSIPFKYFNNFTNVKSNIMEQSKKNNCELFFEDFSTTSKKKYCVLSFTFPTELNTINFLKYIQEIKKIKIESISTSDLVCKLIYASRQYINIMDKDKAKEFLDDKKKGNLYKIAPNIFNILK
tara:strand:+ start:466 stop:852 length:387 start_codon:yes stop_codon:yes gene_type:complete